MLPANYLMRKYGVGAANYGFGKGGERCQGVFQKEAHCVLMPGINYPDLSRIDNGTYNYYHTLV